MIGRNAPPDSDAQAQAPRAFDDFELRLGDIMRGERATIGKSLLDVQRELRIKATYIAAIENADPSPFETPGFVAGYVRSYAKYLGMDPEWAFQTFCEESGFEAPSALGKPTPRKRAKTPTDGLTKKAEIRDPFAEPRVSFVPDTRSPLAALEPRALGSVLVLFALIAGIGYGAWSVLMEIQRVQVTPVDRAPGVIAEIDPLAPAAEAFLQDSSAFNAAVAPSTPDALDRIYRPQALDVPVMVARDGPIASIVPRAGLDTTGLEEVTSAALSAEALSSGSNAAIEAAIAAATGLPQVTAPAPPEVMLVAVEQAWVRVRAADGSIILEKTLQPGESYILPQTEVPPVLRAGAAGSVYFAVNGETFGPAGSRGSVVSGVELSADALVASYEPVDPTADPYGGRAVEVAEAAIAGAATPQE